MTHSFPTRRSSDLQPANARQGRDDVLDHAVDEVVLRGFSTQIQEWHNGEGWFFGKRWRMGRLVPDRGSRTIWGSASGRRPLFPDVADEAEPLAGDCPDQPLILAAVADGLAGRVYVTGLCRFRDDAPPPRSEEHTYKLQSL